MSRSSKFFAFRLKRHILVNIFFTALSLKFYLETRQLRHELDTNLCISEKPSEIPNGERANVKIFDLTSPLEPERVYKRIDCRESARFYTSVTLCTHDYENDVHVSGSIIRDGSWEPHVLRMFTAYINKHPGYIVIDVGAHLGQYTLFAAKLGSNVIAVEPFHANLLRIHKAVSINRLHSKITLVANAISNKRNEIKLLKRVKENIGGQSLLDNNHLVFNNKSEASLRNESTRGLGKKNFKKYLVETILFDDLLDYLPRKSDVDATRGGFYGRAIMKIDIEGFEPYAFQHARNLFKVLDFQIIFMEWGVMNRYGSELRELIIQMMDFLYANDLQPYVFDEADTKHLLNRDEWTDWPWDIFWEKNA